jgi:sirohydrochlorin ferrochelatase
MGTGSSGERQPAIVLIAHGSRLVEANQELFAVAERLQARGIPDVMPSFLELAEPDIPTAAQQCVEAGAARVILLPYFLSMGKHVALDLQNIRDALAQRHPRVEFRVANPLGPHPLLERILLERIEQCLGGNAP